MEPTFNFNDQIDAYLLGHMPEQEQAAFAKQMEQDPILAQEVRLQQDVMQGLHRARVAQLKANLNQIPTPPLSGMGALSPVQWAGVAAGSVAALAGGVALFLQLSATESPLPPPATVAATVPTEVAIAEPAPAQPAQPKEALTSLEVATANTSTNTITSTATGVSSSAYKPASLAVELPKIAHTKPLNPVQPSEEPDENGQIDRPGIGNLPSGKVVEVNEIVSKPEVIIRSAEILSYQYKDNKLYLYGSFGDAIPDIIELSPSKEGHRLYVYFKEKFYTVNKDVKDITPLKPITDPNLEAELTLLRKKKVE
jgi:hypothetical protein